MDGINSDSKSPFAQPTFEGMDAFKTNTSILYNELAEWLVYYSFSKVLFNNIVIMTTIVKKPGSKLPNYFTTNSL